MYKSTPSLTWALDGVGGQRFALAALPLENGSVPIVMMMLMMTMMMMMIIIIIIIITIIV